MFVRTFLGVLFTASLAFGQVNPTMRLLFIHHSVGSMWLSEGGLKSELEAECRPLEVHDATYGDTIGQQTDVCNWNSKFQKQMSLILKFDKHPNIYYTDGRTNHVVMFKSCFPNSDIVSEGTAPGNPNDCKHTVWNHKAAYRALIPYFAKQPNVLFIAVTAPPLCEGHSTANAARARKFNNWLVQEWPLEYQRATGLKNVAAFDFFDVLADPKTNLLKHAYYRGGWDSHPNKAGTSAATLLFIPFFKQAKDNWIATHGIPTSCHPMLTFYGNATIGSYIFLGSDITGGFFYFLDTTMYAGPFKGNCQLTMKPTALGFYTSTNPQRFDIPNDPVLLNTRVFAEVVGKTWVGQWAALTVYPSFHNP